MDPFQFLEERSSERRTEMLAIAHEYQKLLLLLNEDLAIKIINHLAEAMK